MILTEVPLTEIPLTEIPLTPIPNFPVLSIGAPDSASIAPQRTHFKFLITSPQILLTSLAEFC